MRSFPHGRMLRAHVAPVPCRVWRGGGSTAPNYRRGAYGEHGEYRKRHVRSRTAVRRRTRHGVLRPRLRAFVGFLDTFRRLRAPRVERALRRERLPGVALAVAGQLRSVRGG